MRTITTADIAFAIRDMIEDREFHHYIGDQESGETFSVEHVDIGDPNNPVVYVSGADEGEQRFQIRIFTKGD